MAPLGQAAAVKLHDAVDSAKEAVLDLVMNMTAVQ